MKKYAKIFAVLGIVLLVLIFTRSSAYAEPSINIQLPQDPKETSSSIQILLLLTVLSLAPSILIMMTSFTRIIIILSFLRNALGTQQMPPNQVLIGLALFLSLFIMSPVLGDINNQALKPYSESKITQQQALDKSSSIIKSFMLKQKLRSKDLALFASLSGNKAPVKSPSDYPLTVVIPAFLISELTTAFIYGFCIYIPFLVIDMVVSSTLMSMGMIMLPPVMISLPFKILLFILVDGWNLISQVIVNSFVR